MMKKSTRLLLLLSTFVLTTIGLNAQQLIEVIPRGSRSLQVMKIKYGDNMQYGVNRYKIVYETVSPEGQPDTASGLLVVPDVNGLIFPLLAYQHGTVVSRNDVPSNLAGGYELAEVFAGLGYASSAADYIGLGDSPGNHPYVHADSEAWAAADMLRAVREYCADNGILLNDQLFITGYSQGGHASAALQRYLEADFTDEFPVTATAHLSGPYSISKEMVDFTIRDMPYNFPGYLGNVFLSFRRVYDYFDYEADEFFVAPYAGWVDEFGAEEIDLFLLSSQMISRLTQDYGAPLARHMLQDSIYDAILNQPDHPVSQALADNDLLDWAPQAPTRIVYCEADDQVYYRNGVVADSVLNLNGAVDLDAVNIDPDADHGGCVDPAVAFTILFFSAYQDLEVDTDEALTAAASDLKPAPNPAGDHCWVDDLPREAEVQLLDSQGRIVRRYTPQASPARLDLSGLKAGIYLIRVESENGSRTGKLMKQ